jgi:hypothetical protein
LQIAVCLLQPDSVSPPQQARDLFFVVYRATLAKQSFGMAATASIAAI